MFPDREAKKHHNVTAFKNDKYGASAQVKVSGC